MQLRIDRDALDLIFRTLLTCHCPVTDEQEEAIFDLLSTARPDESIDYGQILKIVEPNADTVFRRLADFVVWQAPVGVDPYTINREHVIRHFSSTYHWNHVVAKGLPEAYKKVRHIPVWFLAHMLLPAKITHIADHVVSASYKCNGGEVRLLNIFTPKEHKSKRNEVWAVHFAGLLTRLSPKEQKVASLMLETNHFLREFCKDGIKINYLNFELHKDYSSFCRDRYQKHYGKRPITG